MGSRILSRSFHVEPWRGAEDHEEEDDSTQLDGSQSADPNRMDIDADHPVEETAEHAELVQNEEASQAEATLSEETDEDDEAENPADVAMVPMADLLNARFESENVRSP